MACLSYKVRLGVLVYVSAQFVGFGRFFVLKDRLFVKRKFITDSSRRSKFELFHEGFGPRIVAGM